MLLLDDGVAGGVDRRSWVRRHAALPPQLLARRADGRRSAAARDVPLPAGAHGRSRRRSGLRVPDHDAPRALAAAVGPLPTTSANVSGLPEARDAQEILAQLGDGVDLILDGGAARGGPPSTVVDCTGERPLVLRDGAIPVARLVAILDAAGIAHDLVGG